MAIQPELITHQDTAPYFGRILLAVKDADEFAFFAAINDAAADGVDPEALVVVLAQALVVHADRDNPDWPSQVRKGLAEIAIGA